MTAVTTKKNRACQSGVGLIEVMVTLVVVAVGVLGMVGLQSKSLQYNQTSYLRSQADFLANDMMERIRTNRSTAETSTAYTVSNNQHTAAACDQSEYPDRCETSVCSGNELAEYDLKQWKFGISCQLPDGVGSISETNAATGKIFIIRIMFNDSRGRAADRVFELRGSL